jgi:hypothetical protein
MLMSLIVFCLIGATVFVALYLLARQLRQLGAWIMRREGPRERVGAFIVIAVVLGAIAGGLAQQPVTAAMHCHANGQPVIPCLLAP